MKKIINWLKESHRWIHLLLGLVMGFASTSVYCAALAGFGVAVSLEAKDKMWGGIWDWVDFGLTIAGVAIGYTIRGLIFGFKLT